MFYVTVETIRTFATIHQGPIPAYLRGIKRDTFASERFAEEPQQKKHTHTNSLPKKKNIKLASGRAQSRVEILLWCDEYVFAL